MKEQLLLSVYESEAKARGMAPLTVTIDGLDYDAAKAWADDGGLPYSIISVTEYTNYNDDGEDDECYDCRGNLEDCLGYRALLEGNIKS